MRDEVRSDVLQVVDDQYRAGGYRGINEVLARFGIIIKRKNDPEQFEYAWKVTGTYLVTLWSEDIQVRQTTEQWFYVDTLDTVHRRGGGMRDAGQRKRAERRVHFLRALYRSKGEFIGLLQVNKISIELLEQENQTAEISMRVKDPEHWHVASWDEVRQRAVLVRGPRGWVPSMAEIDSIPAPSPVPVSPAEPLASPAEPLGDPEPELVFPDQAHRDAVELASVAFVKKAYEAKGFRVESVETQNRGYDLEVFNPQGQAVLHLEVKGTSLPAPGFYLTRNEFKCSRCLQTWRLVMVTSALSPKPALQELTSQQMDDAFAFTELVWRCEPRRASHS